MNISEFEIVLNNLGMQQIPFFFMIDFEMKKPVVMPLTEIRNDILYNINGNSNTRQHVYSNIDPVIISYPISFEKYKRKFNTVYKYLQHGDSYLTNLTIRTPIELNCSLKELFHSSDARYKMLFNNQFLVFSPETFVQIHNGKIFSYPMKGTIDASVPSAQNKILNDEKEYAEHCTIVDLIRNDLSKVSSNVQVTRFRYIDEISTNHKTLLQVSSEITGNLPPNYCDHIGTIMIRLLPAGSVSGAPKKKTIQIIKEAEKIERGYYTGIAGIFDGKNLDSCVMIRFIEQQNGQFYYRSGGGITAKSICGSEYEEAINKIYIPVFQPAILSN